MIIRNEGLITDGRVSGELLLSVVREHMRGISRLKTLREYYEGKTAITARVRTDGLPNNRVSHGYARYIATMASGYLIGSPVRYADSAQEAALSRVVKQYQRACVDSVDAEIARYASIFGKGVEIIFSNGLALPRTCAVSPEEAFVVYDESAGKKALFGVHCFAVYKLNGDIGGWRVNVYTPTEIARYEVTQLERLDTAEPASREYHFFGDTPVNEYWNGEDERGDFEGALSLIDAYDALESDRVNDKEQFVDALLVLIGARLDQDERGRSPARQLREDKAVSLPEGCDVKWLFKSLSEADTDVLRRALNDDIHKMTMIPDLTDSNFSSNASGVAMKYKLLGFEQLIKIKERWFREGLRERLRRFARFMSVRGEPDLDADMVEITFSRGLPVNELEQAQVISQLRAANVISPTEAVARLHPEWNEAKARTRADEIMDLAKRMSFRAGDAV